MDKEHKKTKREFNAAFFHSKGNGRTILNTKNEPLTPSLLLEMEKYIQKINPDLSNIFIFSLIEFECE